MTQEEIRLSESGARRKHWKRWGPYLSERAWGTVREDYSPYGNAWEYFSHDQARSRAYRWNEDGLAGISDRRQMICFAVALWNEHDPILKERIFGLTGNEGNHGEDVKEHYFYLDSTPTHSYMKYLYKYPQAAYPYQKLIAESRKLWGEQGEYELLDTGIFATQRYFDVFVEYAKASPEDICIRIEVCNRGPEPAPLHLIPHLWFRNTWSWGPEPLPQPSIRLGPQSDGCLSLLADDSTAKPPPSVPFVYHIGKRYLYADARARPLFTDNETNGPRVWGEGAQSRSRWVKDAFHRHITQGEDCVNPEQVGTKACFHYANLQ